MLDTPNSITFAQKSRLQKELSANGLGKYRNSPKLDTLSLKRASEFIDGFNQAWLGKNEELKRRVTKSFLKEIENDWKK